MQYQTIPIIWGESFPPNKNSHYDHMFGVHPLGEFRIEWKSWKDYPGYCLEFRNDFWISCSGTLEEAQDSAREFADELIQKAVNIREEI